MISRSLAEPRSFFKENIAWTPSGRLSPRHPNIGEFQARELMHLEHASLTCFVTKSFSNTFPTENSSSESRECMS